MTPEQGTDPYVKGWTDCAESISILCEIKARDLLGGKRNPLGRVMNRPLAAVYRHAAEIARATTVISVDGAASTGS